MDAVESVTTVADWVKSKSGNEVLDGVHGVYTVFKRGGAIVISVVNDEGGPFYKSGFPSFDVAKKQAEEDDEAQSKDRYPLEVRKGGFLKKWRKRKA